MGDYEVDTIVGAARSQHILTLNDRKTGKVWLRKLQSPTAAEAADKIIGILECLKQYDLVKTITADNGLQFAGHERVSRATDVGFFFARPYHSWERGANENTRGRDTAPYHRIRCLASLPDWMQGCLCKPQLMLLEGVNEQCWKFPKLHWNSSGKQYLCQSFITNDRHDYVRRDQIDGKTW